MGANTQTSVPAFTAGQILTAQQQTEINTGVPVFADTTARDAAFGGTGEKTLAEGQFAYLEDSNTTQYYDGSAWQTVGINPGLVCVKAETAFSAASSVTADNVFTSTYTNYLITFKYQTSTTNSVALKMRVSATSASTNYNRQDLLANDTAISGGRAFNQTSYEFATNTNGAFNSSAIVNLFNPALAEATLIQSQNQFNAAAYTTTYLRSYFGNHSTATAYDGIEFLVATGTMTGTYTIYGYSKTV